MLAFSVESNVKQFTQNIKRLSKDQIPFATSLAINKTADDVANAITAQMPKKLDRPTPFTLQAYRTRGGRFKGKRARKNDLTAILIPGKAQAEYLSYQVFGGTRTPRGQAIGVPYQPNARLNKFGNVPNRRAGLVKRKTEFVANINGVEGVWRRFGRGGKQLKLIHAFENQVSYRPRLPIFKIANGVIRSRMARNFRTSYLRAIRTAR